MITDENLDFKNSFEQIKINQRKRYMYSRDMYECSKYVRTSYTFARTIGNDNMPNVF